MENASTRRPDRVKILFTAPSRGCRALRTMCFRAFHEKCRNADANPQENPQEGVLLHEGAQWKIKGQADLPRVLIIDSQVGRTYIS